MVNEDQEQGENGRQKGMADVVIEVPSKFESFLETAILRLQYLS